MPEQIHVDNFIKELYIEFPKLKIHTQKPWWLRTIFNIPFLKNLQWNNYIQTIGMNIYLSDDWDLIDPTTKLCILRHERIHLLQFKKYSLLFMSFLYLFMFFPIGLAYFRAKFEREALMESMKARFEYRGYNQRTKQVMFSLYQRAFLSSAYLWSWPFKSVIKKWFNEDVNSIVSNKPFN